jgi:hypothetical protein
VAEIERLPVIGAAPAARPDRSEHRGPVAEIERLQVIGAAPAARP